ncbi:MAG: AAA family ATPase, partial [Bacilli bacterium]|nr:AAA family ATPase [Bacilli bacterium]
MLVSLTVKNFAIIDNISIDFDKGMTVLTGETGAGKSLLIDAIGLLFGDRASSDTVRHGESKATIEGVFSAFSSEVCEILKDNGIEDGDFLVIKREIYENGKSLAKVNSETVNLNVLSALADYLGDIHTQFDAVKLVNPKNYYSFIDSKETSDLLPSYKQSLKEYRSYSKLYEEKKNE